MRVDGRTGDAALRLFIPGPGRRLLLIGDSVFSQVPPHAPQRIGRLSEHIGPLAAAGPAQAWLYSGVVGQARSYAERLSELRFVTRELLPFLGFLVGDRTAPASPPEELSSEFQELEACAKDFMRALGGVNARLAAQVLLPEECSAFARLLGLPCVLTRSGMIALEPLQRPASGISEVLVDGQGYRLRPTGTRPLPAFLGELQRAIASKFNAAIDGDPELQRRAADLLRRVDSILAACGAAQVPRFPLRQGARLEIQHKGGFWVLACGPVHQRVRQRSRFWVGLPISGSTRAERLMVAPTVSPTDSGFFMPSGVPKHGGLCMGTRTQYERLLGNLFSDAEAVLLYFDAAVVIASGRSAFHHAWRAGRGPEATPNRRIHLAR